MKNLLVTGGAGFIGSHFVRYILQKYPDNTVRVLDALTYAGNLENLTDVADDPRFSFQHGSICSKTDVEKAVNGIDCIVNFAAESHVDRSILDPGAFIQTDVAGVFTLLEAAKENGHERFLHVSTDEVYGTIETGSFTEGDPLLPNSPYSASKAGGEMMVRAYRETYGLNTIVTRGSNTFGPFQYPEKLIPLFVTNLIDNVPVPVYGDGQQVRDWMFVEDHCAGIDIALRKGEPGEVYNVGGGNERPNLDITLRLLELLDRPSSLIHYVTDRPGHDRRYSLNCAKLRALGYAPSVGFDVRLKETVDWFVGNEAWWRKIKNGTHGKDDFAARWYANRQ